MTLLLNWFVNLPHKVVFLFARITKIYRDITDKEGKSFKFYFGEKWSAFLKSEYCSLYFQPSSLLKNVRIYTYIYFKVGKNNLFIVNRASLKMQIFELIEKKNCKSSVCQTSTSAQTNLGWLFNRFLKAGAEEIAKRGGVGEDAFPVQDNGISLLKQASHVSRQSLGWWLSWYPGDACSRNKFLCWNIWQASVPDVSHSSLTL